MSHLLAISIGPVQDFIAAARRTQDLQAGSDLLVKIANKVALTLKEDHGSDLIFPARVEDDGPNKILAELPDGKDPATVAEAARKAAQACLSAEWDKAKQGMTPAQQKALNPTLADEQIANFLEFYASWLPYMPETYGEVRKKLDLLLAGRKALRNFEVSYSEAGRPKSPLDPSRDCVLQPREPHGEKRLAVPKICEGYPLWLKTRETLDAISLMKRVQGVVGREYPTPSTSFMAAQAILPQIPPTTVTRLKELAGQMGEGADLGDLLLPGRLDKEKQDAMPDIAKFRREALGAVGQSECPAYYAILVADGDKMGGLLGREGLDKPDEHRKISTTLTDFARAAKAIVKKHDGHPIYAGGDDVLALLPVNQVLKCAKELAGAFEKAMEPFKKEDDVKGGTLSAGVAIVHHMDPLHLSLKRARAAEKAAKVERNSMAVALHTRGGEPLTVALKWAENDWAYWIEQFGKDNDEDKGLARGFPYELRALAREFARLPKEATEARKWLPVEAKRILKRKKGGKDEDRPKDEDTQEDPLVKRVKDAAEKPETLEAFAKKLVIARFLADYEFTGDDHA